MLQRNVVSQKWVTVEDEYVTDFASSPQIMLNGHYYVFKEAEPITVYRYNRIEAGTKMERQEMEPLRDKS